MYARILIASALFVSACGGPLPQGPEPEPERGVLRINEVVSNNEGVTLDEHGETDDYVELHNAGRVPVDLSHYLLADGSGMHALPAVELAPGAVQLLWADDTPEQGPAHLGFKLSADGELLRLLERSTTAEIDRARVPPLDDHHAYARIPDGSGEFSDCAWATPARPNGESCGPPALPPPPPDLTFLPFEWPSAFPPVAAPLAITEVALRPARSIELVNTSSADVELADYALTLARHEVGQPWPGLGDGVRFGLDAGRLAPGERTTVAVEATDVALIAEDPEFEGVLTLWRAADAAPIERVDFMAWPERALLTRAADGRFRFCADDGKSRETCSPIGPRTTGDRLRSLLDVDDFRALAAGRRTLEADSVAFIVDLAADGAVTFLNSADYDLHYTFVREQIQRLPRLDRCDPAQRAEYNLGWYAFSETEYFRVDGRRYLLGTLVRHAGTGLSTLEFAPGDTISPEQMKHAFFTVLSRVFDPKAWAIRPQTSDQVERIRAIEGQVPIVGPNAPFQGVTFQPLAPGVAYGTLRFVAADALRSERLGPRDIVITDQVPNDLPLVGGLITEAFQTPLAHVNILSRGRGTPNMALARARDDDRVAPLLDRLVRLEVTGSEFRLTLAEPLEALEFWESRKPAGPPLAPRLDLAPSGVQPLSERSLADLPAIGGKAADFAELARAPLCSGPVSVPDQAFALPVRHSIEHLEASGARVLLEELTADPSFLADPVVREAGLAAVRRAIRETALDPALQAEIEDAIRVRWPGQPLRFRSSSNAEDLAGFSGAGLYSSVGLDADEVASGVADAVREVWASLWARRAYDERDYYNIDHRSVAMGVLVHGAFKSERVNGVAIGRDILDPQRGDRRYVNVQLGEALVTNPAPGISSEQFTYAPVSFLSFEYHARSSFSPTVPVMSPAETAFLACNLDAIQEHLRPLLDPNRENPWFAIDIEFKLMGPERRLVIKQARPYSFGADVPSEWCDF